MPAGEMTLARLATVRIDFGGTQHGSFIFLYSNLLVNVAGQEVPKVQTDLRCCSVQSVYSSVQHGNAHPGQLPVKYSPLTIIMPFLNTCNSFPGLENGPRQYQGPSGPLTPKQVRQHSGCSAP